MRSSADVDDKDGLGRDPALRVLTVKKGIYRQSIIILGLKVIKEESCFRRLRVECF